MGTGLPRKAKDLQSRSAALLTLEYDGFNRIPKTITPPKLLQRNHKGPESKSLHVWQHGASLAQKFAQLLREAYLGAEHHILALSNGTPKTAHFAPFL